MSTSKIEYALIGYSIQIPKENPERDIFLERLEELEYTILNFKELNPNNIQIISKDDHNFYLGIILKRIHNEFDYGEPFEISLSYLSEELKSKKEILENFVEKYDLYFMVRKLDGYVFTAYL